MAIPADEKTRLPWNPSVAGIGGVARRAPVGFARSLLDRYRANRLFQIIESLNADKLSIPNYP